MAALREPQSLWPYSWRVIQWLGRCCSRQVGGLRVGNELRWHCPPAMLATDGFKPSGAEVTAALDGGVARVKQLPPKCRDIQLSDESLGVWMETFRLIQGNEVWAEHGQWVNTTDPNFGPGIRERFNAASKLDPAAVALASRKRKAIQRRMNTLPSRHRRSLWFATIEYSYGNSAGLFGGPVACHAARRGAARRGAVATWRCWNWQNACSESRVSESH